MTNHNSQCRAALVRVPRQFSGTDGAALAIVKGTPMHLHNKGTDRLLADIAAFPTTTDAVTAMALARLDEAMNAPPIDPVVTTHGGLCTRAMAVADFRRAAVRLRSVAASLNKVTQDRVRTLYRSQAATYEAIAGAYENTATSAEVAQLIEKAKALHLAEDDDDRCAHCGADCSKQRIHWVHGSERDGGRAGIRACPDCHELHKVEQVYACPNIN